MEIVEIKRKMKCKNCGQLARFRLVFGKHTPSLCESCLKELNKNISKLVVPTAIKTKFNIKR